MKDELAHLDAAHPSVTLSAIIGRSPEKVLNRGSGACSTSETGRAEYFF